MAADRLCLLTLLQGKSEQIGPTDAYTRVDLGVKVAFEGSVYTDTDPG